MNTPGYNCSPDCNCGGCERDDAPREVLGSRAQALRDANLADLHRHKAASAAYDAAVSAAEKALNAAYAAAAAAYDPPEECGPCNGRRPHVTVACRGCPLLREEV